MSIDNAMWRMSLERVGRSLTQAGYLKTWYLSWDLNNMKQLSSREREGGEYAGKHVRGKKLWGISSTKKSFEGLQESEWGRYPEMDMDRRNSAVWAEASHMSSRLSFFCYQIGTMVSYNITSRAQWQQVQKCNTNYILESCLQKGDSARLQQCFMSKCDCKEPCTGTSEQLLPTFKCHPFRTPCSVMSRKQGRIAHTGKFGMSLSVS